MSGLACRSVDPELHHHRRQACEQRGGCTVCGPVKHIPASSFAGQITPDEARTARQDSLLDAYDRKISGCVHEGSQQLFCRRRRIIAQRRTLTEFADDGLKERIREEVTQMLSPTIPTSFSLFIYLLLRVFIGATYRQYLNHIRFLFYSETS